MRDALTQLGLDYVLGIQVQKIKTHPAGLSRKSQMWEVLFSASST